MHVFNLNCSNLTNPRIQRVLVQYPNLSYVLSLRIFDKLIDEIGTFDGVVDGLKVDCQLDVAIDAEEQLSEDYVCVADGVMRSCGAYWA